MLNFDETEKLFMIFRTLFPNYTITIEGEFMHLYENLSEYNLFLPHIRKHVCVSCVNCFDYPEGVFHLLKNILSIIDSIEKSHYEYSRIKCIENSDLKATV